MFMPKKKDVLGQSKCKNDSQMSNTSPQPPLNPERKKMRSDIGRLKLLIDLRNQCSLAIQAADKAYKTPLQVQKIKTLTEALGVLESCELLIDEKIKTFQNKISQIHQYERWSFSKTFRESLSISAMVKTPDKSEWQKNFFFFYDTLFPIRNTAEEALLKTLEKIEGQETHLATAKNTS